MFTIVFDGIVHQPNMPYVLSMSTSYLDLLFRHELNMSRTSGTNAGLYFFNMEVKVYIWFFFLSIAFSLCLTNVVGWDGCLMSELA